MGFLQRFLGFVSIVVWDLFTEFFGIYLQEYLEFIYMYSCDCFIYLHIGICMGFIYRVVWVWDILTNLTEPVCYGCVFLYF